MRRGDRRPLGHRQDADRLGTRTPSVQPSTESRSRQPRMMRPPRESGPSCLLNPRRLRPLRPRAARWMLPTRCFLNRRQKVRTASPAANNTLSGNELLGRPEATCFGLRQRARRGRRESRSCLISPASHFSRRGVPFPAWGAEGLPRELSTLSAQNTPSGQATTSPAAREMSDECVPRPRRSPGRCRSLSSRGPAEPACAPSSRA
jgi:hypothetical protein